MRQQASAAVEELKVQPLRTAGWYDQNTQGVNKAGVVPFLRGSDGKWRFYVMKPADSEGYDTPSKFQICKGTREICIGGIWSDYYPKAGRQVKGAELEPLPVTALREGIEEIGLRPSNIAAFYEWGRAEFKSERAKLPKTLWLYLAEIRDDAAFDLPDAEHANTGARQWVRLPEDNELVRSDHLAILQELSSRLPEALQKTKE